MAQFEFSELENYWKKTNNPDAYFESYFPQNMDAPPHKRSLWLCDFLKQFDFKNILEIGSGCGRNLYHIKERFPSCEVTGLDINPDAIEFAKRKVNGNHILGSIGKFEEYISQKFDIIFTMSSLGFTNPDSIDELLRSIISHSNMAVIHLEPAGNGEMISGSTLSQRYWTHNYLEAYSRMGKSPEYISLPSYVLAPALTHGIIIRNKI